MSLKIDPLGNLVWKNEKGQWHRQKGPAIIRINGEIKYRVNGLLHRLDGPAAIYPNGDKFYYIHGKHYSKKDYYAEVKEL